GVSARSADSTTLTRSIPSACATMSSASTRAESMPRLRRSSVVQATTSRTLQSRGAGGGFEAVALTRGSRIQLSHPCGKHEPLKPIVVHVSAEVSPFHKSGGLGDVLSGLPPALARAGLDVRIVTPRYPQATNLASIGGEKALKAWPVEIDVSLGGSDIKARVF